jgi:hypothetical protein
VANGTNLTLDQLFEMLQRSEGDTFDIKEELKALERLSKGNDMGSMLAMSGLLQFGRGRKQKTQSDLLRQFLTGPVIPQPNLLGTGPGEQGFAPSGVINLGGSPFKIDPTPSRVHSGMALLVNTLQALSSLKEDRKGRRAPDVRLRESIVPQRRTTAVT